MTDGAGRRRAHRSPAPGCLAETADLSQSVLSEETVEEIGRAKTKTVTVFDNLFPLPSPISLQRLQQLGCGQSHDLMTTRAISDTQVQTILAEAFRE